MRALKFSLVVLLLIACDSQDEPAITDIFHRWQWVKTTRDTHGSTLTAQELGNTFFYEFTKEGQLKILDNDGSLRAARGFALTNRDAFSTIYFPEDSLTWGYVIRADTLITWTPDDIYPERDYFIKN